MAKRSPDGLYWRGGILWGWRRLTLGGPLKRASTKCRDRQAARLVKAEWERLAADPVHYAANKTTLAEGIVMFLEDARRGKLAPPTLEMYESKCRHIARVLDGGRPLRSIVATTWDGYVKTREEEGAHPHTIKKELIRGYGVLKAAKRRGLYPHDLSAIMPRYSAQYEPRTRALPLEELMALGRELRADRLAHVAFVVATGCRLKESYRALPGHLSQEGFVYLDGTKTKRAKRTIPIAPPLRSFLEFAMRNAPGIGSGHKLIAAGMSVVSSVPAGQGEPVPDNRPLFPRWLNARRDILAACKRAGIAPCTWNDLRRTNATLLSEAGVGSDIGSKLLGHADGRMWETVYGQPRPLALQRAVDAVFDGTSTTQSEIVPRAFDIKKADAAPDTNGLRSRRSQVRSLSGAPTNPIVSETISAGEAPNQSTDPTDTAGVPYIGVTVFDLRDAMWRVLGRQAARGAT